MLDSTTGIISDFFTELEELVVTVEPVTEEVEGVVEDETGEVFFLMDRALTNLSPRDPRSSMDGGSSLKNKLLCRGGGNKVIRSTEDTKICLKHETSPNSCTENHTQQQLKEMNQGNNIPTRNILKKR